MAKIIQWVVEDFSEMTLIVLSFVPTALFSPSFSVNMFTLILSMFMLMKQPSEINS